MPEISFGSLLSTFRASLDLVSSELDLRLDGTDFYDYVLLLSILQANASGARGEIRKHFSIRSIADGIGLPNETARRHVMRLAEKGLVLVDETGCHVARTSPIYSEYIDNLEAGAKTTHALVSRLEPLGLVGDNGQRLASADIWITNQRRIGHLAFEHTLRTLTSVQMLCRRLLPTILFVKVFTINTSRVGHDALIDITPGACAALADRGLLRPARAIDLAGKIRVASTTIGRHLQRGVTAGLYRHTPDGLLVDCAMLASERGIDMMGKTRASLVRLFNDLTQLARAEALVS
ncbi:hypothetical protein GVO57_06055 [Sphingomonas changnyeongensis]|uniref:Uncharacterized protein n=1 Tax=Sphingomonas changnyeongensis TaxID=2698679 RepID=A0A7Z2S5K9_9SPHN|nr:hypothetical protein [Sphingomonas changnyeongensis]QHL90478.1 hypothetical protein GVO57_06055 [Sphingomonas changnyeongensis]